MNKAFLRLSDFLNEDTMTFLLKNLELSVIHVLETTEFTPSSTLSHQLVMGMLQHHI